MDTKTVWSGVTHAWRLALHVVLSHLRGLEPDDRSRLQRIKSAYDIVETNASLRTTHRYMVESVCTHLHRPDRTPDGIYCCSDFRTKQPEVKLSVSIDVRGWPRGVFGHRTTLNPNDGRLLEFGLSH